MQSFVQVDSFAINLRQWVGMRKPVTTGGTSKQTRMRVGTWAAKRAVQTSNPIFRMGLVKGSWVPISDVTSDCEWYCEAKDHGYIMVGVTFYKMEGNNG